jgi:hypothetical protein
VKENGHEIVGVFTIPDSNNREDPVAAVARWWHVQKEKSGALFKGGFVPMYGKN